MMKKEWFCDLNVKWISKKYHCWNCFFQIFFLKSFWNFVPKFKHKILKQNSNRWKFFYMAFKYWINIIYLFSLFLAFFFSLNFLVFWENWYYLIANLYFFLNFTGILAMCNVREQKCIPMRQYAIRSFSLIF